MSESYITHIRVQEDAAHPSSPPPPTSDAKNKKPRIVVIAVRSSGRVRMHKARENNNLSFSIGKTWNLEDLSAIESFNHPVPNASPQRVQMREWAGPVGFTVTISKPYYWQAGTSKEKDFFIASLVKIYRKYTKGQVPELKGFSDKEIETILGILPGQQPPLRPSADGRSVATPPRPPFADSSRPGTGDSRRAVSRDPHQHPPDSARLPPRRQGSQDPSRPRPPPDASPSMDQSRQPRRYNSRDQALRHVPSRERLAKPSQEQLRAPPSRDAMRPPPVSLPAAAAAIGVPIPSPDGRPTTKSSRSELRSPRAESPAASAASSSFSRGNTPLTQQSLQHPAPLQTAERQRSFQSIQSNESASQHSAADGASLFNTTVDRWKPSSSPQPPVQDDLLSQRQRPHQAEETPGPLQIRDQPPVEESSRNFSNEVQALPERKRPLMTTRDLQAPQRSGTSESADLRPPPLSTSRNAAANARPQSPIVQSQEPVRMPGEFLETPPASNLPTPQPQQESIDPLTKSVEPELAQLQTNIVNEPPTDMVQSPSTENESDEAHRPGLGPMIKKKQKGEVANKFFRAANAYNAFKPRAGGAGERLAKGANGGEPDGINAVVPAPSRKLSVDPDQVDMPPSPTKVPVAVVDAPSTPKETIPGVEVTSPLDSTATGDDSRPATGNSAQDEQAGIQLKDEPPIIVSQAPTESEVQLASAAEPRRPKRRSVHQDNYLRSLDIDPRLLDGRGLEFESILTDFGWGVGVLKGRQLEDLEADLKRELGRIEAGSWLGHLEQKDDRVDLVDQMLDRAIGECDELEGLLTLYAVELGSLNDDIAFIEAQSQGLQVQTANQKILHAELHKLVDTISISSSQLKPLRRGDLATPQGISEIEGSLMLLYKAMVTIDPSFCSSNALSRSVAGLGNADVGNMHALQEKRQAYLQESAGFCQRLLQHLDATFESTLQRAKPALLRSTNTTSASGMKLNAPALNLTRDTLWQFGPLILFTKEINQAAWQTLLRTYYSRARPMYQDVFRENAQAWKNGVRKPTGEAAELLFTSVEKETTEGLTSTARRITVKRSQTLAKTFRAASGEKSTASGPDPRQAGRLMPCEVFAGVLEEQVPLMTMEQNFVVGLFHTTSLENIDFADAVMATVPSARTSQDLSVRRLMEPDRNVARQVSDVMEELFGFWSTEMKGLMEWALDEDPIQAVGILTSLAVYAAQLQETSQEYAVHNLNSLYQRLATVFQKTVSEQIRAIEDTKVKIKKRKGVIGFMKIFPPFSAAVENVYHGAAGRADGTLAVAGPRQIIDDAYTRLNKAMWDSLKVIARESPTATAVSAGQNVDPEDKEILNYHILLIENMHHYIDVVDDGGLEGSVLAEWKGRALMDRAEHMEEYVGRVVRRPLGKVLVSQAIVSHESLLMGYPYRILSNRLNIYWLQNCQGLKLRHDPHTPAAQRRSLSRLMTPKRSGAALRRFESALRSTLASRMKNSFLGSW